MKSYALIHELITLVETYEQKSIKGSKVNLADFVGFLNAHVAQHEVTDIQTDPRFGTQEQETGKIAYQLDNNIGKHFVFMSRYAKSYIKKALSGTPLQTAEDFTVLAILITHPYLSKTALINLNIQEKTSGTEVINRLLKKGLVKQWDNDDDKRSKHIAITAEGKTLLYKVFNNMNHVGKMITGNLSNREKLTLQYLLQKLETFHFAIHNNKSIHDLKSLTEWKSI